MIDTLAVVSCVVLTILAIFQLALISGMPLGKYAWGGSYEVLPVNLKIGSAISILLYGIFAAIILSRSEILMLITNQTIVRVGIWVLAVYFCLGVLLNAISRSKHERNVMTPAAFVLAVATLYIALS